MCVPIYYTASLLLLLQTRHLDVCFYFPRSLSSDLGNHVE